MKSSSRLQQEFENACLKHETEYRKMLRAASKLRQLDAKIKRLYRAKRKARKFERQAAAGEALRTLTGNPSSN